MFKGGVYIWGGGAYILDVNLVSYLGGAYIQGCIYRILWYIDIILYMYIYIYIIYIYIHIYVYCIYIPILFSMNVPFQVKLVYRTPGMSNLLQS